MAITPKRCDISVKKAIQQLSRNAGMQGHPVFAGLTLLDLTASSLIGANASKTLESVTIGLGLDYTRPTLKLSHLGIQDLTDPGADRIFFWDDGASKSEWLAVGSSIVITTTTIDTIQDIQTSASPTFTGLTLSGLTQGSVVFAGASGVISQDNSNLFWDDTVNRLGIGVNSGFDSRMGLTISGDMDILHTAIDTDDHAFEIDLNAAGYGDVKAIDIVYVSGTIGAGEDEEAILVNVDESASGPGDVAALEVLTTDVGSAKIFGLEVGINVIPIEQLSGTFGNMAKAENDGTPTLTQFITSDSGGANNIEIFVANGDTVLIGNTAKFEEIEFILETFSNPSVKPTFEFSTGGTSFSSFTPADGTNGLRNNGVVLWLDSDIPSWATNTGGNYEIRITRTKGGNLAATPREDLIQIGTAVEYVWDKDGDVNINSLTLGQNIYLPTTSATAGIIKVNNVNFLHSYGTRNIFLGERAGNFTTTGTGFNVGIGYRVFDDLTDGFNNVAIGTQALFNVTTGDFNIAIGAIAGFSIIGGSDNVTIGQDGGKAITSGSQNFALGKQSLYYNQTGNANIGIGYKACYGLLNVSVDRNVGVGAESLLNVQSDDNTSVGYYTLRSLTTGGCNVAIGRAAGRSLTTNGYCVFIGYKAGYYETGANKLFIDNAIRTNEADGRVKALVYGVFDAATANQSVLVNGYLWNREGLCGYERSSDPTEPSEGEYVIWLSDGTGYGDDGDVCIASKAAGTTKKAILFDASAGDVW